MDEVLKSRMDPKNPATGSDSIKQPAHNGAGNDRKRTRLMLSRDENNGRKKFERFQYERANFNLFEGAEESNKFYVMIKDTNDEVGKRFTDLNFKERITAIYNIIDKNAERSERRPEMTKYKRFNDNFFTVQVILKTKEDMDKVLKES